jgi:hypothetical protein
MPTVILEPIRIRAQGSPPRSPLVTSTRLELGGARRRMELPFGIELVRFLADTRTDLLTRVAQLFTFLGEMEGHVLLVTLIYVTHDKRLAYRLSVLTLLTMSLNHLLKTIIMNPRPFIAEGTYSERWAVSAERAADLAREYPTPPGHAMVGSAFCSYLFASVRDGRVRAASILLCMIFPVRCVRFVR